MLEKDVIKKIREHLRTEYGATVHKYHGSAFGEVGHPDLYGSLPGGRAYFLEVKLPGKEMTVSPMQMRFLQAESKNGAIAGLVSSVEDVDKIMQSVA